MATQTLNAEPFHLFEGLESEKNIRTGQVRTRSLRFDLNALADFEQETGMGFGQLMGSKALFATARGLIWAGLRHEDKAITVTGVGAKLQEYLASGGDINEVLTVVFAAAQKQGAFGKTVDDATYKDQPQLEDGKTIPGEASVVAPAPAPTE